MTELPDSVRALFQRANLGHVASVLPDGAPRKARNLAAHPPVAIANRTDEPYRMAQVPGRVVETVEGDEALAIMDRMAIRYTGKPFPVRRGIALLVEPEKVFELRLPFEHTPAQG
jgi:hypothetical protein